MPPHWPYKATQDPLLDEEVVVAALVDVVVLLPRFTLPDHCETVRVAGPPVNASVPNR